VSRLARLARLAVLSASLAALLPALTGCGGLLSTAPAGQPSAREGWLTYTVGGLQVDAPAGWTPSGDARHLKLEGQGGAARLEVSTPEARFASAAACAADAERIMKRGEGMERVRRHATTFAGARALFLEGDTAGWHVWAWAACDGGTQYQIFLTARTPAPPEVTDVYRALTGGARLGGQV
jgi:hypothetical protein